MSIDAGTEHLAPEQSQPNTPVESQAPFERSKFLRQAGALMLSLAVFGTVSKSKAFAAYYPSPWPCGDSPTCDCCSGGNCCTKNCVDRYSGCGPTGYGWCGCYFDGYWWHYMCCWDYWDYGPNDTACICSQWISYC